MPLSSPQFRVLLSFSAVRSREVSMSAPDPRMDIAKAVAAGTDVDWVSAESTTESPKDRELIRQLRVVAQLAEVHQQPHAAPPRQTAFDRLPRSWGPLELRRELGRG